MGVFDRLFDTQTKELNAAIVSLKEEVADLRAERRANEKQLNLVKDVVKLQEEVETLKIQKARMKEDNDREIRETKHMVGLERKRQEFEAEQSKKEIEHARGEAVLEVREENLDQAEKAFKKEMEFREKRFTEEVGYLKDMVSQILERLPTVTVDRTISDRSTTTRK